MKHKGIGALAEQVAARGRGGDSTLMHIHPDELAGIASLLGPMTINPETGMPEAWSWKKLLAAIGMGAAAIGLTIATGGAAAPAAGKGFMAGLTALTKSAIIPSLVAGSASQAISAFTPDPNKQNQQALSDADQWIKNKTAQEYKRQVFDTTPWGPTKANVARTAEDVLPGGGILASLNPSVAPTNTVNPPGTVAAAEGGELEPEEEKAQKIVRDAMDAIRGQGEDPEGALNTYLAYYGKAALQDLYKRMSGKEEEPEEEKAEGMVKGPGNGMDDMVTHMAHGGQKVLLSNDEFIVPADVVSGLGDGSSEAGARKLYAMMDRVRMERTGTKKQPGKVKDSRVLPA